VIGEVSPTELVKCSRENICLDTIGPPDDEQRAARNMLRSVV